MNTSDGPRWFLWIALAGGAFLVAEHWSHVAPYLVFLLVLACPLMHLFHRHGHGGHAGHDKKEQGG